MKGATKENMEGAHQGGWVQVGGPEAKFHFPIGFVWDWNWAWGLSIRSLDLVDGQKKPH